MMRGRLAFAPSCICLDKYIQHDVYSSMVSAFEVIAEPNRRAILGLLASSEQSVGDLQRRLRLTQPAVSKHLRVLRDSGFVDAEVDAQRRVYRLRPEPLQEVDAWLDQFRKLWAGHLDKLERYLDAMDKPPATRKKTRRKPR